MSRRDLGLYPPNLPADRGLRGSLVVYGRRLLVLGLVLDANALVVTLAVLFAPHLSLRTRIAALLLSCLWVALGVLGLWVLRFRPHRASAEVALAATVIVVALGRLGRLSSVWYWLLLVLSMAAIVAGLAGWTFLRISTTDTPLFALWPFALRWRSRVVVVAIAIALIVVGLAGAAGAVFAGHERTGTTRPTGQRLGNIDLTSYCNRLGYSRAYLSNTSSPWSWVCQDEPTPDNSNPRSISVDMQAACAWQYRASPGRIKAVIENTNDAYAWACYLVP
jgi:hypothetical protein